MTLSQWRLVDLGSVVDVLDARRVPVSAKERATRIGDVPYYGASGRVGSIDAHLFDEPLILLGEDGVQFFDPYKTKAYLIDGPGWVNNHAHVLKARPNVDRRYLAHFLNQFDYRGYANGTTRLKLTQGAMRRIPVLIPSLDEQRRIVAILEGHFSCLDRALLSLVNAGTRLAALRSASANLCLQRTAKNHEMSTIGDRAILVQYGTSEKTRPWQSDDDIPVLRMGNLQRGNIDWTRLKYLSAETGAVPGLRLRRGDLLFNRTNSAELVGKSAVVDADRPASFASYLIRVRFDDTVLPEWANLLINSGEGRRHIKSVMTQQVGQANVNGTKLKAFPLLVPSVAEQRRLLADDQEVALAENAIRVRIETASKRASALRLSLLAAAFSGRLTVDHTKELISV